MEHPTYSFETLCNQTYSNPIDLFNPQLCATLEKNRLFVHRDPHADVVEGKRPEYGLFAHRIFNFNNTILNLGKPTVTHTEVLRATTPQIVQTEGGDIFASSRHLYQFVCAGTHQGANLLDPRNKHLLYVDLVASVSPALFINSFSKARGNEQNCVFEVRDGDVVVVATKYIPKYGEILEGYFELPID